MDGDLNLHMILRMVFSLVLVLGLLGLMAVALRKWGHRFGLVTMAPAGITGKRIQLVETAMLDARHRVVIVRCDGTEHAVILGGSQPVVLPQGQTGKQSHAHAQS